MPHDLNVYKKWMGLPAEALVEQALVEFGSELVIASSLGAEDQVLTHMAVEAGKPRGLSPRVFVLDTGRLHQETYDTLEASRAFFGISYEVLFPDREAVEKMVREKGPNLFYESVDNRKACCYVRKVEPLGRVLKTARAWVTGQRREQSITRAEVQPVEWDPTHQLLKLNPLWNWSSAQVWDYIRAHHIPYNKLHDQGFPSIGCAPCTRAVAPGEDERAGRWWWEQAENKECGLHIVDGKLVRKGRV
ncbi:MAG: phosphoadenylyl-sulfate reductase [Candidatus Margulisiibacteriota bacterium]